jgi:hypothetical protein
MSVPRTKLSGGTVYNQMCEDCGERERKSWTGIGKKALCKECKGHYEGIGGGCSKCAAKKKICRSCKKPLAD